MALKIDAKFHRKLTCVFQNDSRNLETFYHSTRKSQNWDFEGIFLSNLKCISLKFTEELCVMRMKNDAKFEADLTCRFKTDMRIWQILTRALKILKNLHFHGLLLSKVYNVWAKKVQKSMFDSTEDWCKIWRKTELCFPKWYEDFGKFPQAKK